MHESAITRTGMYALKGNGTWLPTEAMTCELSGDFSTSNSLVAESN